MIALHLGKRVELFWEKHQKSYSAKTIPVLEDGCNDQKSSETFGFLKQKKSSEKVGWTEFGLCLFLLGRVLISVAMLGLFDIMEEEC